MIYIIKWEGLYQNKVSPATVKWAIHRRLFVSFTKRENRHFHVVVVMHG